MTIFPFLFPLAVFSLAFVAQYCADIAVICIRDPRSDDFANMSLAVAIVGRWIAVVLALLEGLFRFVY